MPDVERKILTLLSDRDCVDDIVTRLAEADFATVQYRAVFKAAKTLWQDNKPVTLITLAETLGRDYWPTISELNGALVASRGEANVLIDSLLRQTKRRRLKGMAESVLAQLADGADADTVLSIVENTAYTIAAGDAENAIVSGSERAKLMLQTLSENMATEGKGIGIKTSFGLLNRFQSGGFKPGNLYLLAGKTGRGKTAFVQNLIKDIAIAQKLPTLYCNTEMASSQLSSRILALLSDMPSVTHEKISTGDLSDAEFQHLCARADLLNNNAYFEYSDSDMSADRIVTIVKRCKAQRGLQVVAVDYVGRLSTDDPKLAEWQVLSRIVKRLKGLAMSENVAVILLAQITEEEKLEGARKMENEVDFYSYLLEMTDDETAKEAYSGFNSNYWLVVKKNRMGRCGKIPFLFDKERLKFYCGGVKIGGELADSKQKLQTHSTASADAGMFGTEVNRPRKFA